MKCYIFSILSAALFVAGVSAQLTVNTPTNVLSCTPLQVTWNGGTPTYTLSVHDGANPNGAAYITFSNLTGTSYTWQSVTFQANTNLDLTLRDSSGLISQSAPFTVQSGGSTSCLNATGSNAATTVVATSGSTGSTPTTGGTTNSAATGTTPGTTGQTKGTSSGSASGSSSTTKSASSSSAATPMEVSYGVAGIIGAFVAAVFV